MFSAAKRKRVDAFVWLATPKICSRLAAQKAHIDTAAGGDCVAPLMRVQAPDAACDSLNLSIQNKNALPFAAEVLVASGAFFLHRRAATRREVAAWQLSSGI
jgi:hypothetical protein